MFSFKTNQILFPPTTPPVTPQDSTTYDPSVSTIALQLFPSEELLQCWNIYKLTLKEGGFFKAVFQIQVQ